MNLVFTIYKNKSINIFHQGEIFNIESKDKRFKIIEDLLIKDKHSDVLGLLDPKIIFKDQKSLTFKNDRVYYKGEILPLGIANAIFEGIINNDNINNYLYIWEKCWEKIKQNRSQFWNFQANKLFYNVYPFEEFLLCLATPDMNSPLDVENLVFLKKDQSHHFQYIIDLFMKKMNLSQIMKELHLSGDKLKKALKNKMIENKLIDPSVLFFADKFKGKISQDHLIELLLVVPKQILIKSDILTSFFDVWANNTNGYSINKVKKILLNNTIEEITSLLSTLALYPEWVTFTLPDFKNLLELETFIKNEAFKLRCDKYSFDYLKLYPTLNNVKFKNNPELKLIVPTKGSDLVFLGQCMGNCIGGESYMKKAHHNQCLLIAFSIEKSITFTLEIIGGKLKQFEEVRGFQHHALKYKEIICEELRKNNILRPIPLK